MARIRKDVAALGAGWVPELEWYAKAIRALQSQTPDIRTSWRYLAAIHGFDEQDWRTFGIIADDDPLPPQSERLDRVWDQCQHQSWYFLPWHRGYLWSFEAIVAAKVEELGGPSDWALPYWNYLDNTNPQARDIPAPFLEATLPDGSPNPLSDVPRSSAPLGPVPWFPDDIDLDAMQVPFFTSAQHGVGFGGSVTAFNQFQGQNGALEEDPHNVVHVMLGGNGGFMIDPNFAALDPIFWLHHCNIDRLWAAWLATSGNVQENRSPWRDGPSPRRFEVPDASGGLRVFAPSETLPGGSLAPEYDDLSLGTGIGARPAGIAGGHNQMTASLSTASPPAATIMGANAERITVGADPVETTVQLDSNQVQIAAGDGEQRVLLNIEQIKGTAVSGVLTISLRAKPDGAMPAGDALAVKSLALFGLARASAEDEAHGGVGISIAVDVTELLKKLGQAAGAQLDQIEVRLEQPTEGFELEPITVEKVSLYRQPVEH